MARAWMIGAVVVAAASARAEPPRTAERPAGQVVTEEGRTEILSSRVKVGARVELPEGWYRVEEAGPEDARVGSFTVVSREAFAAASGAPAGEVDAEEDGSALAPRPPASTPAVGERPAPRCGAERSAYLAELWRERGIEDVKDPAAVMAGVDGETAPWVGSAWLAFSADAFRSLAWSPALRDRARALARCVRGE